MEHILLLLTRALVICLGLLLIYIALFMHEDEEGKLQNRLEELWIRIDDKAHAAAAKHTVFLKAVLDLFNGGFNLLFGAKTFSLRAIAVTLSYSEASLLLLLPYSIFRFDEPKILLRAIASSVFLIIVATSSIIARSQKAEAVWSYCTLVLDICAFVILIPWILDQRIADTFSDYTLKDSAQLLAIFVFGITCDIIFIAINRTMIAFTVRLNRTFQIVLMLLANIAIGATYMAPFWLWPLELFHPWPFFYQTLNLISQTNLITALLACSITVIMTTALLHRIFWPLISRPTYAIARFRVARKPALLLSTSIVLLSSAIPAWAPLLAKLKEIK